MISEPKYHVTLILYRGNKQIALYNYLVTAIDTLNAIVKCAQNTGVFHLDRKHELTYSVVLYGAGYHLPTDTKVIA